MSCEGAGRSRGDVRSKPWPCSVEPARRTRRDERSLERHGQRTGESESLGRRSESGKGALGGGG